MATVTRENIGLLNDKLIVKVSKEDYLQNFEKTLKNHSKNANMPGFRKGMVPAGLVKKMYGPSLFTDEVLKTVEKGLFDYLETEKLEIFAQPVASDENDVKNLDCNNPADYTFGFEIGLKPEIVVSDLQNTTVTKYNVLVTDEMVHNELERLQQKHGKMTEPETATSLENILNVTFTPCDENGVVAEDATPKDNSLLIKYFNKTYQDKIIGAKKDDSFTFQLSDALEDKELQWVIEDLKIDSGNRYYKMDVIKVGFIEPRELDEAFFVEAFPNKEIKTLEDAKAELKKEIEGYWELQTKNQMQDGIYHQLVDHTNIDFPESFLKKWMQTGREKQSTPEEVEQEYPQFSKSLKWTLISDHLSKQNDLKVDPADIKAFAVNQLMGYMGVNALDENNTWVEDYANKMMKDKKFVEDTYHRVITEKLFDWASTQVKTNVKDISVEDFTKLVQEHKH